MEKIFACKLGIGLAILTLAGFVKRCRPKHFLGLMNVDTQHSVIRVPLTLALLYAGTQHTPLKETRSILTFVGVFYLAVGAVGSVDKRLGGLLPSRLTSFDVAYHYGVGALALWLGKRSGRMMRES